VAGLIELLKALTSATTENGDNHEPNTDQSAPSTSPSTAQSTSSTPATAASTTTPSATTTTGAPLTHGLNRHHLSTLIPTLRLLESVASHPSVPLLLHQEGVLPILIKLLQEVNLVLGWEPSIGKRKQGGDVKGWTAAKREKQYLHLAIASLKVLILVLSPLHRAARQYRNSIMVDTLLKLSSTIVSHPLFGISTQLLTASGTGSLISRTHNLVITLLGMFTSHPTWNSILSDILEHTLKLPKYLYGGIQLFSYLLPPSLPLAMADFGIKDEVLTARHAWVSRLNEPIMLEKLGTLIGIVTQSSSKRLYSPLVNAVVRIIDLGVAPGMAVVTPILDTLRTVSLNLSTQTLASRELLISHRLLYLVLAIAHTPSGKAILQNADITSVLLPFLSHGNKVDQKCQLFVLSTLSCLCSVCLLIS
jgi:hypothetical protein